MPANSNVVPPPVSLMTADYIAKGMGTDLKHLSTQILQHGKSINTTWIEISSGSLLLGIVCFVLAFRLRNHVNFSNEHNCLFLLAGYILTVLGIITIGFTSYSLWELTTYPELYVFDHIRH